MAELETLHLQGGSMVNYAFEVFPLDATFHPIPAVYVVTKQSEAGNREHRVLYVGETDKMPEHLRDHPMTSCFTKEEANCVGVHRLEDAASREAAAADLRGQLHPICNE